MLPYIILGFLQVREMTGYDIKQMLSLSTSNFYDASFGSIYPMLKKLQNDGWITAREAVESGKFRVVYSITEAGRTTFGQWLLEPIEFQPSRQHFLVRLFFYDMLPRDQANSLIGHFVEEIRRERQKLVSLEQRLDNRLAFLRARLWSSAKNIMTF